MQVKDITDKQCHQATLNGRRTLDNLVQLTGAPCKVALRKLERMVEQGKMDYGTSVASAWWLDYDKGLGQ